jgi:alpha-beta hydrolase superfamily lysophospholipase
LTADWIYPITKSTTLLSQGRWVLDHARDVQTPMLIMYGDQDELIDRSACDHLQMRSGSTAKLVRWSQGRHDLFHDRDAQQVMDSVIDWLRQFV